MRITLVIVGKTDKQYLIDAFDDYCKRISRYIKFDVRVVPEIRNTKSMPIEVQMQKEATATIAAIADAQEVVLLDERGAQYTSVEFAAALEKRMVQGHRHLVFVIGGPYGFAPEVRAKSNSSMSLSGLTFSHQLVRVIFAEQLYRALTIIKGEPYHHI